MTSRHRTVPLALGLAVLAAGCASSPQTIGATPSPPAPASSRQAPTPSRQDCIILDSHGDQVFVGQNGIRKGAAGEELSDVVADHPDIATGTAFCSHYEGLAIFVSDLTPELRAAIGKVSAKYPGLPIETRLVPHSYNELMSTGRNLGRSLRLGDAMVGWGPVIYDGSLEVDVRQDAMPSPARTTVPVFPATPSSRPVVVRFRAGGEGHDAVGRADESPSPTHS